METVTWYAVVFTRDWKPGEHWHDGVLPVPAQGESFRHGAHRVPRDHPDRKQHWKTGELFAVGTFVEPEILAKQGMQEIALSPDDPALRADGNGPDFGLFKWNPGTLAFEPLTAEDHTQTMKSWVEALHPNQRAALKALLS